MQPGENETPEKWLDCSIFIPIKCFFFQKIGLLEHLGTILFQFRDRAELTVKYNSSHTDQQYLRFMSSSLYRHAWWAHWKYYYRLRTSRPVQSRFEIQDGKTLPDCGTIIHLLALLLVSCSTWVGVEYLCLTSPRWTWLRGRLSPPWTLSTFSRGREELSMASFAGWLAGVNFVTLWKITECWWPSSLASSSSFLPPPPSADNMTSERRRRGEGCHEPIYSDKVTCSNLPELFIS